MDPKRLGALAWFLAGLALVGCGGSGVGPTAPVSGKVTYKDKAVTTGSLSFWPAEAKGNKSKHVPGSPIKDDGSYELWTKGTKGAPPGWYKVIIVAQAPKDKNNEYSVPKSLIPEVYLKVETSPLWVEVVDNPPPGAYDFTLK
jgi:hypothetical protein